MKPVTTSMQLALVLACGLLSACHRNDGNDASNDYSATTPATDTTAGTSPDTSAMASDATTPATTPAPADTTGMATMPVDDATFYRDALDGGRKEVALSRLAAAQSTNAEVKRVAQMLVDDHTAMNDKLAAASGLPANAPSDSTLTSQLQGKTGADLDRSYADMMVSDHQATIAKFENAAQNASSDAARKLAADALPKLREHLQMAQQLQQKVGGA